ncbi:MAG: asparagine synthase-related protein [Aeromicrobium sp.]
MNTAVAFWSVLTEIANEVNDPAPAIASSAGCDSNALLLALVETGHHPTIITFTLDDRQSRDSLAARENARRLGLDFELVTLPSDPLDLGALARATVVDGVQGKANIEVLTPMRAMIRKAADTGHSTFLTGIQADCHFGVTKKEIIRYRHSSVEEFDAYRRDYFATKAARQSAWIVEYAARIGVDARIPYIDQRVCNVFLGHSWDDLNKPRQKEAIRLYPGLENLDVDKVRSNLQLGDSGVASTLARLVDYPHINVDQRQTVTSIYNRWVREVAS